MRASREILTTLGLIILVMSCAGCGAESSHEPGGDPEAEIARKLALSLHGTTRGMEYWYEGTRGGFETLTGIPYDNLACNGCHVEPAGCEICHGSDAGRSALGGKRPAQRDEDCLGCHGNQYAEVLNGLSDYHRDEAGMRCSDCHGADDAHGDGETYSSLHEPGAIKASCGAKGCHETVATNAFHENHAGEKALEAEMECAACHLQSVVTCYNCHFEYEVAGYGKLSFGQFTGWKFLLRREEGDGRLKIGVGNMLTVTYQGKAFVAVAPYYAHTVAKNAISDCGDCHDNEYVQEYQDTGRIVVAAWNEPQGALVPNIKGKGIIPIPPDWETSLQFDFATYDDTGSEPPKWISMTPTQVGMQMLFAEPLEKLP